MDWKDLLASKVETGELIREDFIPVEESAPGQEKKKDSLHVVIERKGRKGKTATIIEGFSCDENEAKSVAAKLKTRLGTGGSARGNEILIQGERLDDVRNLLRELGYRVK